MPGAGAAHPSGGEGAVESFKGVRIREAESRMAIQIVFLIELAARRMGTGPEHRLGLGRHLRPFLMGGCEGV